MMLEKKRDREREKQRRRIEGRKREGEGQREAEEKSNNLSPFRNHTAYLVKSYCTYSYNPMHIRDPEKVKI